MALHVRGVVLPDGELRDLWLVGDRVTYEPVAGAETVADRGFVLPGLVDAHCHIGIRPGGEPVEASTRPGARRSPTGTRACSRSGTPARRTRTRSSTTTPTAPAGPGRPARRAAEALPARRRRRGRGGRAGRRRDRAGRAGNGWVKLVGDWIDRDVGDLAPAWDAGDRWPRRSRPRTPPAPGSRCTRSPRSRSPRWSRPASTRSSTAPACPRTCIDEMARRGTALVPTMINIETFGGHRRPGRGEVPRRTPRTCAPCATGSRPWSGAAHEAGVPIYSAPTPAAASPHGLAARGDAADARRAGIPARRCCAAGSWGARAVAGLPRPGRGRPGRLRRLRRRPAHRPAGAGRAAPDRPARRVVR